MKTAGKLIIFVITFLALNANAQSTREQQEQRVQHLKETVDYEPIHIGVLRGVIEWGRQLNPAPIVPAESYRADGRGKAAFKQATSTKDFVLAAEQFKLAVILAPWVAEHHFNLALAYEKAGQISNARYSLENYLLADPNAADANDVNSKIGELQAAEESRESRAWERLQNSVDTRFVDSLEGKRWSCGKIRGESSFFEIRQGVLYYTIGNSPTHYDKRVIKGKEFIGWGTPVAKINGDGCYDQRARGYCGPNGWFSDDLAMITIPKLIDVNSGGLGVAIQPLKCCGEFACFLN